MYEEGVFELVLLGFMALRVGVAAGGRRAS